MRKSRIALAVASFIGAAALALGTVAGSSHNRVAGAAGQHTATLASTTTGQGAQNLVPVQLAPAAEPTEMADPTESASPEPTDTPEPSVTPEPDADVESNVQEQDSGSPPASTSTSVSAHEDGVANDGSHHDSGGSADGHGGD